MSTPTKQPLPYTVAEERRLLFEHIYAMADHWVNNLSTHRYPVTPGLNDTEMARMEGFIFSLFVTFDGGASHPAMDIRMAPHPSDKDYLIEQGERWHEPGLLINDCSLHDEWTEWLRKRRAKEGRA